MMLMMTMMIMFGFAAAQFATSRRSGAVSRGNVCVDGSGSILIAKVEMMVEDTAVHAAHERVGEDRMKPVKLRSIFPGLDVSSRRRLLSTAAASGVDEVEILSPDTIHLIFDHFEEHRTI